MKILYFIVLSFQIESMIAQRYFYGDSTIEYSGSIKITTGYNKDSIYNLGIQSVYKNTYATPVFVKTEEDTITGIGKVYYYEWEHLLALEVDITDRIVRFSGLLDCGAGLVCSPEKHSKKAIAFVKTSLFCYLCHAKDKQNEMFTKNTFCEWVGADYAASPHTAQKSTPTGVSAFAQRPPFLSENHFLLLSPN